MPMVKVSVVVTVDDTPIASFPITRRTEPTEAQSFDVQRTTGAAFTAIPTGEITTVSGLVLQSDKTTAIRLNGVAGEITLNANGVLVLLDGSLATAPTLQNNSGATARVRGYAFGA